MPDGTPTRRRGLTKTHKRVLGATGSIVVVVLVFVFILPRIADYRSVLDVVRDLDWQDWALLGGAVVLNLSTFPPPWMAALPGLGYRDAMAMTQASTALSAGVTDRIEWAPELGLTLSLRMDALAIAMIVLVSGVGALIMIYAAWYFGPRSTDAARSAALLVAFAGMMLGLVLADDLLTLYVFWELTSLTSFLLVGQGGQYRENRRAAVQALVVTVFGGLAMLLGIVLLGQLAGTYSIPEITAAATSGTLAPDSPVALSVSLVLILLGALTKSAQLPFHPWLPYAMAAPTPISAYLHAASMVKAGVVLVARLGPAFSVHPVWWAPVMMRLQMRVIDAVGSQEDRDRCAAAVAAVTAEDAGRNDR